MAQEIGESREAWGWDIWRKAEDFANRLKREVKPFYIVYAAKQDIPNSEKTGTAVFRQTFKAYFARPPAILGILVWYVNHPLGVFEFVPELSAPIDVPLDPNLLSQKSEDTSARVSEQGQKLHAISS